MELVERQGAGQGSRIAQLGGDAVTLAGATSHREPLGKAQQESGDQLPGVPGAELSLTYVGMIGVSTAEDATLAILQGGAHEANRNARPLHLFTLHPRVAFIRNAAVEASAMLRASPGDGITAELEEAYLILGDGRDHPQLKLGRFFAEVGRFNPEHFEDSHFVDKPVIHTRLFGPEQLSNGGIRILWPFSGTYRLFYGVQSARGETASSFLFEPGEEVGGHGLIARRSRGLRERLHWVRGETEGTLSEGSRVVSGLTALWGPNASGMTTTTSIIEADVELRRTPGPGPLGGLTSFRLEALGRRYEAGDPGNADRETLRDWGLVVQGVWRLERTLAAGMRLEYADGRNGKTPDPERSRRMRATASLTRFLGRHVDLRVQYNRDWPTGLQGAENSFWLQLKLTTERVDAAYAH